MKKPVRVVVAAIVLAVIAGAATIWAQRPGGVPRPQPQYQSYSGNVRYDGKFVFIRMSYAFSGRQRAPWSHDYPDGEHNFMKLFTAIANVTAHVDETSIMSFSDPEMFKFPLIYLCEPGYFAFSDSDVTNLRNYLLKGGFMVVDDFPSWAWGNFDVQMSRVFPEGHWIELQDASHQIFHSFFEIESLSIVPMAYNLGDKPRFMALFEDNDPHKRMYAIANYQNDISEFWEWSASGRYMVSDNNEAYKVGINQFIYGITH
jgi:hypothetical protein